MTYDNADLSNLSPAMAALHAALINDGRALLRDESAWIPQGTRQTTPYQGEDALLNAYRNHAPTAEDWANAKYKATAPTKHRPQNATGLLATDWAIDDYTTWK